MAIYKGDKKAALYKGDKHPAELYCGEQKAAGYRVEEQRGADMIFENTYNAQFDQLSVYGKSTQERSEERKESAKSVTSFEFAPVKDTSGNVRCSVDSLQVNGQTQQKTYSGHQLIQPDSMKLYRTSPSPWLEWDGKDMTVCAWAADVFPREWIIENLKPDTYYTMSADVTKLEDRLEGYDVVYQESTRMLLYCVGEISYPLVPISTTNVPVHL